MSLVIFYSFLNENGRSVSLLEGSIYGIIFHAGVIVRGAEMFLSQSSSA